MTTRPATTNQQRLDTMLATLATGDAYDAIMDARDALYPTSYDPATGVLADAETN
jgi:hypothetical protein